MLAQLGLHGGDADGRDGFDDGGLAEEPQAQVDVVDRAVDEDTAGEFGVGDEEAGRVEFVAGLRAEDRGSADGGEFGVGITVRGVEAAGESAEDFLIGVGLEGGVVGVYHGLGDLFVGAEGLLAQDVEAFFDGGDGLRGMDDGGAGDDDAFEARVFEHLVKVLVDGDAFKVLLGPFSFCRLGTAGCYEIGPRSQGMEM